MDTARRPERIMPGRRNKRVARLFSGMLLGPDITVHAQRKKHTNQPIQHVVRLRAAHCLPIYPVPNDMRARELRYVTLGLAFMHHSLVRDEPDSPGNTRMKEGCVD